MAGPSSISSRVKLGVISGTHGVHGRVKIRCLTESLDSLTAYGPLEDEAGKVYPMRITGMQEAKGQVIAEIEGITRMEQAEAIVGTALYVKRSAMPEAEKGAYYHVDLIGLSVRDAEGKPVGEVVAIHNFGSGDILEVLYADGVQEMFLFDQRTFPEINPREGYLVLNPPAEVVVKEDGHDAP